MAQRCLHRSQEASSGFLVFLMFAWMVAGVSGRAAADPGPEPEGAYRHAMNELQSARAEGNRKRELAALAAATRAAEDLGRSAEVIRHGTDLLQLQEDGMPATERADTLARVGKAWFLLGDHEKALNRMIQALELAEADHDRRLMARIYNFIGFVHRDQKNYEKAIELFTKAAGLAQEIGDARRLASSLNEIGNVRFLLGQPEEGLALKQQALAIATNAGERAQEAYCLNDIGYILSKRGHHQEALARFEQSMVLLKKHGQDHEVSTSIINAADEMTFLGRASEAAELARQVIGRARAGGQKELLASSLEVLARAEAASGRHAQAYEALREAHELRAVLFDESGSRRIAELQTRFEFEKKERQIRDLENDNAIHSLRLSRERILRYAAIACLFLVGLLAFLVYNRYRISLQARRALQKAHDEIATKNHELRLANDRLAQAALTDVLTGALNRRGLMERVELERVRFMRNRKPFSVVLGDIDFFKSINDRFGHQAGDHVLSGVSRVISGSVRKQDATARWGGEEFLILLPETDLAGALVVAEKVRNRIQDHHFESAGDRVPVTMTFGVCEWASSMTFDDCTKLADEALYTGKREGRNRVVRSAPEVDPNPGVEDGKPLTG